MVLLPALQVDDSYGSKKHSDFLKGYGFLPNNGTDTYEINLVNLFRAAPPALLDRLEQVAARGGQKTVEALRWVREQVSLTVLSTGPRIVLLHVGFCLAAATPVGIILGYYPSCACIFVQGLKVAMHIG